MMEAEKLKLRGVPMGTWIILTYPEVESYKSNWEWVEKAMRNIVSDEAAPPKKKRKEEK